jgi:chromosome segregation ATPase
VSEDYADDPDLAEWCKKVRASYNCNDKSKLASHRLMTSQIAELEKLGFDFSGGKIPRRNRNILNSRSDKDDAIRQDVGFSTKTWCSQVRQEVQMIAASINEAFKENEKASSQPSASEEDLRLKIRMLSEENKSLQAKVHKYLKEKESIELTEKTVNSQLDSLNNENSTLKKQIQDLVEEKNSLCQNGKKYERKNQFLLATLKQLQEDKMLLKNQYEEKITKLSEKYQEEKQATELKLQKEKMICSKQQKLIQRLRAYMLSLRKDDDHDQNTMSPNRVN